MVEVGYMIKGVKVEFYIVFEELVVLKLIY